MRGKKHIKKGEDIISNHGRIRELWVVFCFVRGEMVGGMSFLQLNFHKP